MHNNKTKKDVPENNRILVKELTKKCKDVCVLDWKTQYC